MYFIPIILFAYSYLLFCLCIVIALLKGTLMLIEEDKILWSLLVDHQLFAITKLDIMVNKG